MNLSVCLSVCGAGKGQIREASFIIGVSHTHTLTVLLLADIDNTHIPVIIEAHTIEQEKATTLSKHTSTNHFSPREPLEKLL